MTVVHVKRREPATPGSIPDRLQMFSREVRFYRELACSVGLRVPDCHRAEVRDDGSTLLELEDLSGWRTGADPAVAARLLRELHDRWEAKAVERWPWLPREDVSDLVENLFDVEWPRVRARRDLSSQVRALGDRLCGHVREADRAASAAGPWTLVHGDASSDNMRTSESGEVALLDWEDYGAGPGVEDLAWFLVSSVDAQDWDRAIAAYGPADGLRASLPSAAVQALFRLGDEREDSPNASVWIARLEEAARRS
jgi:thiamine kinase-like enzyme